MIQRLIVLVVGVAIGLTAFWAVNDPVQIRIILAVAIVTILAFVAMRKPQTAMLAVLAMLPALGLARRMLIPIAGWSRYDALLLIAPVVSLFIAHRVFIVGRRPIAPDVLSKLVLALSVLALIETVNPAGGGVIAGLIGLLFIAAPLVWYFIGREILDRRLMSGLLVCTALAGVLAAAYGLYQQLAGFPSWDSLWVSISGYAALSVGAATRAFGTLSSSAEYATLLAVALVVSFAGIIFVRRQWLLAIPLVPLLGYALFLESSRGIVILALAALVVMLALRTGNVAVAVLVLAFAAGAALYAVQSYGPQLTQMAEDSDNPFIAHQVSGLMNPFDPEQSTYLLHQQMALTGLVSAVHHPLGVGTAVTNLASWKQGTQTAGTELDLTDTFIGLGLPGGLIFSALWILTLSRAIRLGLARRDVLALATVGVLIVTVGQWLNGGYYAVAPLVWTLIGWMNREWLANQAACRAAAQSSATKSSAWERERATSAAVS